MQRSRRGVLVALCVLTLSLAAFAGTALQIGFLVDEALAQSSVRPPDDAVNIEEPTLTPAPTPQSDPFASSVSPPPASPSDAPSAPGIPRARDAVDPSGFDARGDLGTQGPNSDATLWGELRQGVQGTVSIPDRRSGVMIQPVGIGWGEWRAKGGPLQEYGGWAIGGVLAVLALFYLVRGRMRVGRGLSGQLIERFSGIERFAHWTLATSFILLALSGLNLLYGKDWVMPWVGKELFATWTLWGKWLHNNIAWAFMLALILIFAMWIWHNIPTWTDVKWIARGGGFFSKHSHPSAHKFNAGQKLVFWATILLGVSVSASGLALLFPYEIPMFAKTFVVLNDLNVQAIWGSALPTELTAQQEQQYSQIWHSYVGLTMIAVILAHIYIGTIGQEGAFSAMGSGMVDRNWAEEHHDLWVEEKNRRLGAGRAPSAVTPAE